jgi:hypothetical protein
LVQAPFPENIKLELVISRPPSIGSTSTLGLFVKPGGRLSAAVFDIHPGDTVALNGYLAAREILNDRIKPVTTALSVNGQNYLSVDGAQFGLGALQNISSIELHRTQAAVPYPPTLAQPTPRLAYAAYAVNQQGTFQNLSTEQKKCVCFNWFLEFVAYRNLYVRVLKLLLAQSANAIWSNPTWSPLQDLNLTVDDGAGGAFTSAQNTITAHLEFILKPTDDVCIHEMSHAFSLQYWSPRGSKIYYPPPPTIDHQVNSYSNEFFAFQEGFAQFMASLFMNPSEAYFLGTGADWRNLYQYQNPTPGPDNVDFGYIDGCSEATVYPLETGIGLVLEGAFAAALGNLWTYNFWQTWKNSTPLSALTQPWVQDPVGDGTLNLTLAPLPNRWLLDVSLLGKFAYFVFDSIDAAAQPAPSPDGKIAGMISTRRVIDQIEKRTPGSAWPAITWPSIAPLFDRFKVVNEFYVSSVTGQSGVELIIVRSSPSAYEYATVDRNLQQTSQIVIPRQVGDTFTLRGVRFPTNFSCSIVAAAGSGPGLPVVSTATAVSQYQATVQFTAAQLGPVQPGACRLLFETAPGQTGNHSILVTTVLVQP